MNSPLPSTHPAFRWVSLARPAGICLVLLWSLYCAAQFRTTTFGLTAREWAGLATSTLLLTGPAAALIFLGQGWRRAVRGALLISAGSLLAAEVYARSQEQLVRERHGPAPEDKVVEARWWPYRNHAMVYTPGLGWTGTD